MKKTIWLIALLYSVANSAVANSKCENPKNELAGKVLGLCSSFRTIEGANSYMKLKYSIEKSREEYQLCEQENSYKGENYLGIYVYSLYVLDEAETYLEFIGSKETSEKDNNTLSRQKKFISTSVTNQCMQFFSAVISE